MSTHEWDQDLWVTRAIDALCARTVDRPFLVGGVTIGGVPLVLSLVLFALTWTETTPRYVASHLLVIAMGLIGPGVIWYWEREIFTGFVEDVSQITADTDALERLAGEYSELLRRRFWVFSLFLVALFVGVVITNMAYYRTIGVAGIEDPAFWVLILVGVTWGGVVGIGFHMAIVAVLFIRAVGQLELTIDPLHPDGLGGLSAIGSFAIWTTMFISIGSLAFPYAFLLTAEGSAPVLIYGGVGVYIAVIGTSFLYPTIYVNRRAQAVRERELERMRSRIRDLEAQARDPAEHGSTDEVTKRLEIQRLREEFNDYATVSLYPLSVGIITRLLSSILLPIAFTMFELWFSNLV